MGVRTVSIRMLRDRKQSDEMIVALGGVIQADGLNVVFEAGEVYDQVAEVLKLPAMPKRKQRTIQEVMAELGPPIWAEIHAWCERPRTQIEYEAFRNTIAKKLPCGECRQYWLTDTIANPPSPEVLADLTKLKQWGIDRHNAVNRKLGKPEYPYNTPNP